MPDRKKVPFGSWESPITSDLIVFGTDRLVELAPHEETLFWIESRSREAGRMVLMRREKNGLITEVLPSQYNVRTAVHEYGGSCFAIGEAVYFSNFKDQRIYRSESSQETKPITPEGAFRYADLILDRKRDRIICVREDHSTLGDQPVNNLVTVPFDRSPPSVLISGNDFYASPRLSPNQSSLAWLTWNLPNMPWDGTELHVANFGSDRKIADAVLVAGGRDESIFQPEWSPDGTLYFVSDRTGWWNLYRWSNGEVEPVCPMQAEFGEPQWVFGISTYSLESQNRAVCYYSLDGAKHLAIINLRKKTLENIELPYQEYSCVKTVPCHAYFLAASSTSKTALVHLDLATRLHEVLYRPKTPQFDSAYISVAKPIEFPTSGGFKAYGLYYEPKNRDYEGPAGELPPLLVMSHGGPTGSAYSGLLLSIQFWTSRGIAVLDVNYGGSTGYGRAYRERLNGQWGIVDVDDCVNGARYLSESRKVDGKRLMITGGSAGGYTTLCALTFRKVFSAGASHYGIGDLDALEQDTHKFESKYSSKLIGPYPKRRDLYLERSPINHVENLSCPVIFFQGLDDKVVPPNQAERMVNALREKRLPVAYLTFEGEGHGFRKAENIKRSLNAELYFYSKVLGFPLSETIEPIRIENLPNQ